MLLQSSLDAFEALKQSPGLVGPPAAPAPSPTHPPECLDHVFRRQRLIRVAGVPVLCLSLDSSCEQREAEGKSVASASGVMHLGDGADGMAQLLKTW